MAAITLKKNHVSKFSPEPHSWPVPFYCRLLDTCLLIHLSISPLARLDFLPSAVPERLIVAKKFDPSDLPVRRIHDYCNPLGFMCIPEISQHAFWISGSGNILSANNFQRLNKGVEREKNNRLFFYFHRFSDFPYTNGCFPIMAATALKFVAIQFLKVYLRTSFVASTFLL